MTDFLHRLLVSARQSDRPWYRIEAKASERTAQVDLYGLIGGWFGDVDTSAFVKDVRALDVDEIQLSINSPGGSAFDGVAIHSVLAGHKARVVTTVEGLAASAASIIAMSGDEIVMARGSQLMIHDAAGLCMGQAADMEQMAQMLDKTSSSMAGLYADRAGGTADDWRAAMKAETWYTAEEAVEAGLADRVLAKPEREAVEATAQFDLSIFAHAGRAAAPAPFIPAAHTASQTPAEPVEGTTQTPTLEAAVAETTTLREGVLARLGVPDADADDETVLAALDEALAEQVDPAPSGAPNIPEGTVLMDAAQVDEMRAAAEMGRMAHERQTREDREQAVEAAVHDGRIAPARRDHWRKALETDPGAADVLAGLEKGLIPVAAIGHEGDGIDMSAYEALYGTGN